MRGLTSNVFVVGIAMAGGACINSIPAPDAGNRTDAGHTMDNPAPTDAGPPLDAIRPTDVTSPLDATSADVLRDAGAPDVPLPMIPLTGIVSAMVVNTATGSAYAALACNGGSGVSGCASLLVGEQSSLGIAVIDTNTDMPTTTIPPLAVPTGASGDSVYNAMAVDPVANVVYVAAGGDFVWVVNGATNTLTSTLTTGLSGLQIEALAVDPSAPLLYVAATTSMATQSLVVINTTTNTVVGTPTPLVGLTGAYGLTLDTAHQRLFVCGNGPSFVTVNTTTNAQVGSGATMTYAGQGATVGCDGLPGFAEMVTMGLDGGAGVVHALEPADYTLPASLTPATSVTVSYTSTTVATYVFGIKAENNHIAWSYVQWDPATEAVVGSGGPTVALTSPGGPVGIARVIRTAPTMFDVYVVTNAVATTPLADGGMVTVPSVSTVTHLTIPISPSL